MPLSQAKFNLLTPFCEFLGKVNNTENLKKGVDMVVEFREILAPYGLEAYVNNLLKGVIVTKKKAMETAADKSSFQAQINYVQEKIDGEMKGF